MHLDDVDKKTHCSEHSTCSVLQKYSRPTELSHFCPYYSLMDQCILGDFFMMGQHKIVHNCEVEDTELFKKNCLWIEVSKTFYSTLLASIFY